MWSPAFVPKPPDWGPLVDVCGNFFSTKLEVTMLAKFRPPCISSALQAHGPDDGLFRDRSRHPLPLANLVPHQLHWLNFLLFSDFPPG